MWDRPFWAAAVLLRGAPPAQRTLAIFHKIGGVGIIEKRGSTSRRI
jgi:hypothetical protein